jgi:allantoinase
MFARRGRKDLRMALHDLALVNGRVVLPGGLVERVGIGVRDGKVATVTDQAIDADEVIDVGGLTVLPGLIDEHFHTWWGYGWETHENASRAAAKGGITTLIEMPLDRPLTLSAAALRAKLGAVGDDYHVDYAAFGGYLEESPDEMTAMADAGVVAFKLFTGATAPPGVYPGVDSAQMLDALRRAKDLGIPVVVHAENAAIVAFETERLQREGRNDPRAWDEARPWFAELEATERVCLLAEVTGCRTIVAHVPSPQAVRAIDAARRRGADVWTETCPHQLCLTQDDMAQDTRLKWNPPTRDRRSVEELWKLLAVGQIHAIGSDHAPLPKTPNADIWTQNPGAGNAVESMFPVFATEAMHNRGIPITKVADLLSTTPAKLFGLYPRKGAIQAGSDADFTVVETNGRRILDARELEFIPSQDRWSPFDGRELRVFPQYTIVRGRPVFAEGEVVGQRGLGQFLANPVATDPAGKIRAGTVS